jgi:hypothetical protein
MNPTDAIGNALEVGDKVEFVGPWRDCPFPSTLDGTYRVESLHDNFVILSCFTRTYREAFFPAPAAKFRLHSILL